MATSSRTERIAIGVLLFAFAMVVAGLLLRSALNDSPDGIEFAYGSGLEPGAPIRVQITGAVASPGVYNLREGDRVVDALAAAGGPATDGDIDSLNLARRVRDEEKLVVPRKGGASTAPAALAQPGAKLDINTATERQLDALPGIGEAYSRRIVDSRRVDGPYKNVRELVDRNVLPNGVYERVRDLITVGP